MSVQNERVLDTTVRTIEFSLNPLRLARGLFLFVIALVCATVGVILWVLMGSSSSGKIEKAFGEIGPSASPSGSSSSESRFSTTKIQAREVNDRLEVDATEVETDREYALVVDEEALKKPAADNVDEHTRQMYADSSEIDKLLEARKFDDAYEAYVGRIQNTGIVEFHSEVEKSLSDHFLSTREFDKAARILEHHVATHAADDIATETYFNLGYVHFFNKKMNKSRRFLKLYVEREENPGRIDRARKILSVLEQSSSA